MDEILCLAHLNVGFVICILRLRFHASSAESLQSAPFANSLAIISGIYYAIYILANELALAVLDGLIFNLSISSVKDATLQTSKGGAIMHFSML